jgi:hypothetical protein
MPHMDEPAKSLWVALCRAPIFKTKKSVMADRPERSEGVSATHKRGARGDLP